MLAMVSLHDKGRSSISSVGMPCWQSCAAAPLRASAVDFLYDSSCLAQMYHSALLSSVLTNVVALWEFVAPHAFRNLLLTCKGGATIMGENELKEDGRRARGALRTGSACCNV